MSKYWTLGSALLVSAVIAQEVYVPTDGPTTRDNCPAEPEETQPPEYTFTPYSHVLTETLRYATSIAPSSTTGSYARPSEELASLVPSLSYTTWGAWDPEATATPTEDTEDPYGQAEWTKLWEHANPPNFTAESTSLYSTTVSPTPIPSNELVLPARDYFGPTDCYNFPPGFRFGVASSASQIEGATAQEGKAPSLMDILVHDDRPKAYVTNEHYYLYKQDIERVAAIGVKYFSFSIAWTRILPFALPGTPVNQKGIDHYDDVINFIIEKGMTPVVTLLHFDSPLQFYGDDLDRAKNPPPEGFGYQDGGYNNQTFQDAFVHYAKVVMTHYADRVPVWFTFNEPLLYSVDARAIDNVVRAHARVYHFYKEELKGEGQISFKLNNNFGLPLDPTSEGDVAATDRFNEFQVGSFCNPVFLGKDYPESLKSHWPSDLPELTDEDLEYINGTADFLGIDPYTATIISAPEPGDLSGFEECAANTSSPYQPYCAIEGQHTIHGWNMGYRSNSYVYITPTYLRAYLNYLYTTWRTPIEITEFGFPVHKEAERDLSDQLFDSPRSTYYLGYMSEVLKAIWEDGVKVVGAHAWSFADNWEFGSFDDHFGIQTVNRTTLDRRYKKSFFDFVDFMKARGVD